MYPNLILKEKYVFWILIQICYILCNTILHNYWNESWNDTNNGSTSLYNNKSKDNSIYSLISGEKNIVKKRLFLTHDFRIS